MNTPSISPCRHSWFSIMLVSAPLDQQYQVFKWEGIERTKQWNYPVGNDFLQIVSIVTTLWADLDDTIIQLSLSQLSQSQVSLYSRSAGIIVFLEAWRIMVYTNTYVKIRFVSDVWYSSHCSFMFLEQGLSKDLCILKCPIANHCKCCF